MPNSSSADAQWTGHVKVILIVSLFPSRLHTTAGRPSGMGLHAINLRFATSGRAAEITGSWLDHAKDRWSRKGCQCPHGA